MNKHDDIIDYWYGAKFPTTFAKVELPLTEGRAIKFLRDCGRIKEFQCSDRVDNHCLSMSGHAKEMQAHIWEKMERNAGEFMRKNSRFETFVDNRDSLFYGHTTYTLSGLILVP